LAIKKINIVSEFVLFGIVSDKNNYTIVSQINSELNYAFSQKENIKIIDKTIKKEFPVFEYIDECNNRKFRFINNYYKGGYLVYQLKEINFLIQIYDNINYEFKQEFIKKIKSLKNIILISEIDKKYYKKIKHLHYMQ